MTLTSLVKAINGYEEALYDKVKSMMGKPLYFLNVNIVDDYYGLSQKVFVLFSYNPDDLVEKYKDIKHHECGIGQVIEINGIKESDDVEVNIYNNWEYMLGYGFCPIGDSKIGIKRSEYIKKSVYNWAIKIIPLKEISEDELNNETKDIWDLMTYYGDILEALKITNVAQLYHFSPNDSDKCFYSDCGNSLFKLFY